MVLMKVTLKVPEEIPVRAKARRLWVEEYLEKILRVAARNADRE